MNLEQRNEEIWRLRRGGATFSEIAKRFDISKERARRVYEQKKERIDNFDKWPPLKRALSARVQNVLVKTFGSEEIFNHPEKLASVGEEVFITWKNFGRKSMNELIDVLEKLGYHTNRHIWMTDMKSQSYFGIGKRILQKYFDYSNEKSLDDTEYIPVVRLIIEGISEEMSSAGMPGSSCNEVAEKLKAFNRSLYQNIWIKHTKEDQDPDEEPLDLEKEYETAKRTFDYIYDHGEHPE
ncbi:MAG TPA: hypothetical protein VLK23_11070 [Thermodesulfobacteriota bacterium]|nr:hypothetical protein [Thermodesulfobacteriota bacterium]